MAYSAKFGKEGLEKMEKLRIQDAIREAEEKINTISADKIFLKKAIEYVIENLKVLPHYLEKTDYRIALMGQPGCGKTSTLVGLSGLLSDSLYDLKAGGISKSKASLLPVGSGGTTMAECMEIHQIDEGESEIIIECCSQEELENILDRMIEKYYLAELGNDQNQNMDILLGHDNKEDHMNLLPIEIERYVEGMCRENILNMIKENPPWKELMEKKTDDKKKGVKLKEIIRFFIRQKNEADFDVLQKEIREYIRKHFIILDEQYRGESGYKEIHIPLDSADIKENLRKTLSALNNGKFQGIPIVRNMRIMLSSLGN